MTQHVLSRQPILTAIAVAAVSIACAGYVRKLFALIMERRAGAKTFGDKLRATMERHRAHPLRYGLVLGGVLGLLVSAGIAYVGLDVDKRASERALASLQFCHLALRSAQEQHALAEQRDHLASIQASERDIRALVDRLPPVEQAKAREIAGQLATSLGRERELVAQFAEHADDTAHALAEHQAEVQRGLSKLDGEVAALPASVAKVADDVHTIGKRADTLDGELSQCTTRLDSVDKSVADMAKQLDALAARPATACVCNTASTPAPPPAPTSPASATATATSPAKAPPAKTSN